MCQVPGLPVLTALVTADQLNDVLLLHVRVSLKIEKESQLMNRMSSLSSITSEQIKRPLAKFMF